MRTSGSVTINALSVFEFSTESKISYYPFAISSTDCKTDCTEIPKFALPETVPDVTVAFGRPFWTFGRIDLKILPFERIHTHCLDEIVQRNCILY